MWNLGLINSDITESRFFISYTSTPHDLSFYAGVSVPDEDGNLDASYVGSYYQGFSGGSALFQKISKFGSVLWSKLVDERTTGYYVRPSAIDYFSDGDIMLYSRMRNTSISDESAHIMKVSNDFSSIKWQKSIENISFTQGAAVDRNSNSTYILGNVPSTSVNQYLSKFNSSGTLLWSREIDDLNDAKVYVDQYTSNVYVIGYSISTVSSTSTTRVIKISSSGSVIWTTAAIDNTASDVDFLVPSGAIGDAGIYVASLVPVATNGFRQVLYVTLINSSGIVAWETRISVDLSGYGITTGKISVDPVNGFTTVMAEASNFSGGYYRFMTLLDEYGEEVYSIPMIHTNINGILLNPNYYASSKFTILGSLESTGIDTYNATVASIAQFSGVSTPPSFTLDLDEDSVFELDGTTVADVTVQPVAGESSEMAWDSPFGLSLGSASLTVTAATQTFTDTSETSTVKSLSF